MNPEIARLLAKGREDSSPEESTSQEEHPSDSKSRNPYKSRFLTKEDLNPNDVDYEAKVYEIEKRNKYFINKHHVIYQTATVDPIYYQKPYPEHFSETNDDSRFGSAFDILDQMVPNLENPKVDPWKGFPGTTMDKLLIDAKKHPHSLQSIDQFTDQIRNVLDFVHGDGIYTKMGRWVKNSCKNDFDRNVVLEGDSLSLTIHDSANNPWMPIYKYRTFLEPLLRPVIIDGNVFQCSVKIIAQILMRFISTGHRCVALFPENHSTNNDKIFESLKLFKLIQIVPSHPKLSWKNNIRRIVRNIQGVLISDGVPSHDLIREEGFSESSEDWPIMPTVLKGADNEFELVWPADRLYYDGRCVKEINHIKLKYYTPKSIPLPTMIGQQLYLAEQSMFLSVLLRCGLYSDVVLWRVKSILHLIQTRSSNPSDILWKGYDLQSFPLWSITTNPPKEFYCNNCAPKTRIIQKNWEVEAELLDDDF